jgi:hypothetical protein
VKFLYNEQGNNLSKTISLIEFIIIEIVLLPLTIVGGILFRIAFILKVRVASASMTAYDPLIARWMLHVLGKRFDEAGEQLLNALPDGVFVVAVHQ